MYIVAMVVFLIEIISLSVLRFIIRLKNRRHGVSAVRGEKVNRSKGVASDHEEIENIRQDPKEIENILQGVAPDQKEIDYRNGEAASVEQKEETRHRKVGPVSEEMELPQYID